MKEIFLNFFVKGIGFIRKWNCFLFFKPPFWQFINASCLSVGIEFELADQKDTKDRLQIEPFNITTDTCESLQQFEYFIRTKPGKYFAIWGCHQISESKYDRGLWVFGEKFEQNRRVENAQQMITDVLIDMKLENETRILENMIININQFTPFYEMNCFAEIYNNQCNFDSWYESLSQEAIVSIVIFSIVALVVAAVITFCIYAYYKLVWMTYYAWCVNT